MSESITLLRPKAVAKKLGWGLSTLWKRAKEDPDFPKSIKFGTKTTCWYEHEIDAYVAKKAAAGHAK